MHSRVLTLVQSLPLQCFTDTLLLGPSHMPVAKAGCGAAVHLTSTSHSIFHVVACSKFMHEGSKYLRLTTFLTNTFQLMTSCDFGAPHFPIPMRHVEQSKEVISCTLALKRKSNAKNVPRKQWNNRWQSAYLYDHSIDPCSKFPVVSPIFSKKQN